MGLGAYYRLIQEYIITEKGECIIAILLHNGTVLLLSNKCFSKGHEPGNGDIVNTVHSEIGYSPSSVVLLRR